MCAKHGMNGGKVEYCIQWILNLPHMVGYYVLRLTSWKDELLNDKIKHDLWVCNSPIHDLPSPVYPSLHVQVKEHSVLVQVADEWQSWVLVVHSSISVRTRYSLTIFTWPYHRLKELILGLFVLRWPLTECWFLIGSWASCHHQAGLRSFHFFAAKTWNILSETIHGMAGTNGF